jgi:hypothetical protein
METSNFSPSQICFGLNQDLDRQSFSCFLQLAGRAEFANLLAERLSSEEIENFIDSFTGLLRTHVSKNEYHQIFLRDESHHHHEPDLQE